MLARRRFNEFKEELVQQGDVLVDETLPDKIQELNSLLASQQFAMTSKEKIVQETRRQHQLIMDRKNGVKDKISDKVIVKNVCNGNIADEVTGGVENKGENARAYKLPGGIDSEPNKFVVQLFEVIRPFIYDILEDASSIKLWISCHTPQIEDGNNFGVTIQEDVMSHTDKVISEVQPSLKILYYYHADRAAYMGSLCKYPNCTDTVHALEELDGGMMYTLRATIRQLRDHYIVMYDVIQKNKEKLKCPKSNNVDNMY